MAHAGKVMRIEDALVKIMRWNRGKTLRLVDEEDGARNVDVHINPINVDSGPGFTHYHVKAENIYIVSEGQVEAIVEPEKYRLDPCELLSSLRRCALPREIATIARVIEIYQPAGQDFEIVEDERKKIETHACSRSKKLSWVGDGESAGLRREDLRPKGLGSW